MANQDEPGSQRNGGTARERTPVGILQEFLRLEAAGGIVLVVAAAAAIFWANLPGTSYTDFWHYHVAIGTGALRIDESLGHWVNDALMTIFFFLVGMEIKRELAVGELRDPRAAALPIMAAVGGMAVPAGIYAVLNAGGPGADGWAIPVATDIAFVVGVLALFGTRLPSSLRVFLLTLAIADDIGGIVIIAIFYTSGLSMAWLAAAAGGVVLAYAMQRLGVYRVWPYLIVGVVVWFATFESGIHATIAGVVLGLLTPARPFREQHIMENLEHRLLPFSNFLIIPIFALANAGVPVSAGALQDAFSESIAWGIALGLVVGKTVGITLTTLIAHHLGIGRLPSTLTVPHVIGGAMLAGIGFTVALFITELSFAESPLLLEEAKLGVFAGSLIAGVIASVVLVMVSRRTPVALPAPDPPVVEPRAH